MLIELWPPIAFFSPWWSGLTFVGQADQTVHWSLLVLVEMEVAISMGLGMVASSWVPFD